MGRKGSPVIRVWPELHAVLKELSEEEGFILADLTSAILMEAILNNPAVVAVAIARWYEVYTERAMKCAFELQRKLSSIVKKVEEAEVA